MGLLVLLFVRFAFLLSCVFFPLVIDPVICIALWVDCGWTAKLLHATAETKKEVYQRNGQAQEDTPKNTANSREAVPAKAWGE